LLSLGPNPSLQQTINMNCLKFIGLVLSLFGTIILATPSLKFEKYFNKDKDKIIELGNKKYTTERDKENAIMALFGVALTIIGLILLVQL